MERVHWLAVYLYCHLSTVVAVNKQCYNGHCFIKPDPLTSGDVQKTFTDAQQWCRDNSAVLLEIPDEHVQAAVQSYYTDNAFVSNPFLNAQFQQTNWTWTDGTKYDSSWGGVLQTGRSTGAYIKFDQANNITGISAAAMWDTTTRAFICQYPGDQCPSSLTDGLCIEVNSSSQSWFGARLGCFQHGGDLASLQNIHISSLVNKLQSQTQYWIGLTNGQWIWQDSGTQLVYNNWRPGSPGSSTCLNLFNRAGLWTDCDCGGNTRPFICLQNANFTSTSASQTFSPMTSILTSSYSQPKSTSKSSSQVTSFSKSSEETPSTSKSNNQTTSTPTFSDQRSTTKSNNQTISSMASSNQMALALGAGIGGGVGLIIIIILVVVAAIICTRRHRERSPDNTHPIKVNDPSSVYAQVIPSKDPRLPGASVESSPRNGKDLIYVDLAPSEEVPSNSARRQTMRPPDLLPESFKQRPNVIVVNNGDIYSVPHKTSSTSQG